MGFGGTRHTAALPRSRDFEAAVLLVAIVILCFVAVGYWFGFLGIVILICILAVASVLAAIIFFLAMLIRELD